MIAAILFSAVASGLVILAGRRDAARDPRLTFSLLVLMVLIPVMAAFFPKIGVLPTSPSSSTVEAFPWKTLFVSIWAVGFSFYVLRLLIAAYGISRWRKKSTLLETSDGVEILQLAGLQGPVATGILRKAVFVPENWICLSAENREMVLRHELCHHRRRDPLWLLLVEITRAANWFNPLVHWMAKRFTLQCEFACDEQVIRSGTDAKRYAGLLCDFAEERANTSFALAMADSSSLEKRVGRMIRPATRPGTLRCAALGLLGVAAACGIAMLGETPAAIGMDEVELRFSADPFPGER